MNKSENIFQKLSREELRSVKGGVGGCRAEVVCHDGRTIFCESENSGDTCYQENSGSIHGYISCTFNSTGTFYQRGCWEGVPTEA